MLRKLPYSHVILLTDLDDDLGERIWESMVMQPMTEDSSLSLAGDWVYFDLTNIDEHPWGRELFSLLPKTDDLTASVLAGEKILIIKSTEEIIL